jgi:polar amino acid transport system ATP-binding protein
MNDGDPKLIRIHDVRKAYDGHEVLKGVGLEIARGELLAIIGPSGCGKSTFLRCLNCLEILDGGRIEIGGHLLERAPGAPLQADFAQRAHALRESVGMVFQSFNLFPHKTILENAMLAPMVVKGTRADEAAALAEGFLAKVGLARFHDRYPASLSGGQQQRAAIARALTMQPQVMLYDEPTSALDPGLVDEVLQVMRDLDAEGMTQIVVTHEMRFAKDASDYIAYMEAGEIVEIADEDEIFAAPRDERTRRFLKNFLA